jgi:hypothetical protein
MFPSPWWVQEVLTRNRLIKRAAIVGRLYYHTAQCLLAQINPLLAKECEESRAVQQHHAHQVCGIVAHTTDRGVSSVAIRSLAIVAEVLDKLEEQQEVVEILERIESETGWRLAALLKNLKRVWGWEKMAGTGLAAQFLAQNPSTQASKAQQHRQPPPPIQTTTPPNGQMMPGMEKAQQTLAAPRPLRNPNPLSNGDFSLPDHPYKNWYEPPTRTSTFSSTHGFL